MKFDLCSIVVVLAARIDVSHHEPDILLVRDTIQHLGQDLARLHVPVTQVKKKKKKKQ